MHTTLLTCLAVTLLVSAHASHGLGSSHRLLVRKLSGRAQQEAELHHLFKRASNTYPTADLPGPAPLAAWTAAYTKAKAAGLIPAIPNATNKGGTPTYPTGTNPLSANVCSWTWNMCNATTDIVNAPDNVVGISFDDGPQPDGQPLYKFLAANNIPATHFMIGSRILDNAALFKTAFNMGNDIAVHTWSHPLMTTMTDAQVLGELGWTMQIIYDYTGGLLPQFWRPPYGDVDNRVRAIAQQVFGLTTVIWNKDTNDWCLNDNGSSACPSKPQAPTSEAALDAELTSFLSGSKSPGLIILEHEHKSPAVQGFIQTAWPLIQSKGWTYDNIPGVFGLQYYQNAANDTSPMQSRTIAVNAVTSALPLANAFNVLSASASALSVSTAQTAVSASRTFSSSASTLASQSAANLAASVPSQSSSDFRRLSTAAKIGIALGSIVGVALILLLSTCLFIRRRRSAQARGGPNVGQHPYIDMLGSSSGLTFDEKAISPTKEAPTLLYSPTPAQNAASFDVVPALLYAPPVAHDPARKSTASIYSQHEATAFFDGPSEFNRSASQKSERPPTQRFHLPTSVVLSGVPSQAARDEPQPPQDRAGWL